MRWVLMTALGVPTEPEVNRNLAMVSGVMREKADITAASLVFDSSSENGIVPSTAPLAPPATTTPLCRLRTASMAGMKRSMGSA